MERACHLLLILLLNTVLVLSLPRPAQNEGSQKKIEGTEICSYSDKPNALAFGSQKLTSTIAKFTQSIYLHMAEKNQNGNFVFSPLSMHSALTMLYLGTTTNSTSRQELSKAMGGFVAEHGLSCSYKSVVDDYSKEKSFRYGNKFWLQKGQDINANFQQKIHEILHSDAENIDFNAEGSVDMVNAWVAAITNGKITKMVKDFSRNTVLYLANALYFKEEWLVPFEDVNYDETPLRGSFETPTGSKDVPMIQQINYNATYGEVKIFGDNEFVEVLSLPYKNDLFEMQIILPPSKKQFSWIESKMQLSNTRDLTDEQDGYYNIFSLKKDDILDELKEDVSEVYLRLPTFQLRSDLDVVDSLKKLGAKKVFESGAELAELGDGQLSVSKISHSALVEVTKEGTEGAAATGAEIVLLSSALNDRLDIVVDRPFIFVVQDKKNKIPVLVGRVMDPTVKIP